MVGERSLGQMKRTLKFVLSGILLSTVLPSCVDELDFDQFDQLDMTPTFEASIIYVEASERVINLVTETNVFNNDFNFDAFSDDVFAKRVLDGVVTYEVENTTSKNLEITVEFLDIEGAVLDAEVFTMQKAPTLILQRDIAYGSTGRSIDIIKNLSSIRVTAVNLGDNISTSSLPSPMITLKSSGKFRVRIK